MAATETLVHSHLRTEEVLLKFITISNSTQCNPDNTLLATSTNNTTTRQAILQVSHAHDLVQQSALKNTNILTAIMENLSHLKETGCKINLLILTALNTAIREMIRKVEARDNKGT
jgi:hypothetical protein